jgi:hypothetical protein
MARKKKRRKSLAKRIASVGGLNRHAPRTPRKNQIPLPILEKRAGKLIRLVHRRGGEPA